jgi:hypothetical protein
VHGYVVRRSTLTNALPHVGARFLQKFDIKDFFASVATSQIEAGLVAIGLGVEAANLVARLTSCEGRLPLGARTSPRISNLMLMAFDDAMSTLASRHGVTYTRFADDLSFSGSETFDLSVEVERELDSHGFTLNAAKTRTFKRGQPMYVTGLGVSDEHIPRLRKRFKAKLRQEFYFIQKHGLDEHATWIKNKDPRGLQFRIMGRYHYARMIEPAFTAGLEARFPDAHRALIPTRSDDRIQRVQRHRDDFLRDVSAAPAAALPFYEPTIRLGMPGRD